jgi:hypothetical protein
MRDPAVGMVDPGLQQRLRGEATHVDAVDVPGIARREIARLQEHLRRRHDGPQRLAHCGPRLAKEVVRRVGIKGLWLIRFFAMGVLPRAGVEVRGAKRSTTSGATPADR